MAAPQCTCRLADAGARVIKIERPEGDFAREYDHVVNGESANFVWLNLGKQSVVLDLGKRLRRIHECAYRWQAEPIMTDAFIQQVCETQQRMGLLPEVRLFIKQIVRYLDMAEQDGTLEGLDLTDQIIATQKEIVQEKTAQPPAWDA